MADTNCVVGQWASTLDDADVLALTKALHEMPRVRLHEAITESYGNLFALTTFKDHVNGHCLCAKP